MLNVIRESQENRYRNLLTENTIWSSICMSSIGICFNFLSNTESVYGTKLSHGSRFRFIVGIQSIFPSSSTGDGFPAQPFAN